MIRITLDPRKEQKESFGRTKLEGKPMTFHLVGVDLKKPISLATIIESNTADFPMEEQECRFRSSRKVTRGTLDPNWEGPY